MDIITEIWEQNRKIHIVYFVTWAITIISYWLFWGNSWILFHHIVFMWILLPVVTFILSTIVGIKNGIGIVQWSYPIFYGAMHILGSIFTIGRIPNMLPFFVIAAVSAGGLLMGSFIKVVRKGK